MARKKQQLINYHTSKAIMPQAVDVQLGEIVVRHATDKPELLIKKDNNEFATFVDSGKVQSMITTSSTNLQGKIDAVSDNLRDNYATSASTEAAIKAVDTKLTTYYATSADTESAIATAKSEAVSSGKGYTDAMVAGAKKDASDAIATTNSNLSTLSGSVDSFSATVVNDYATKVIASGYAMTAEANAVASGKGYTDGQISAVITAYTQADKDLDARIDKLEAISAHTQSAVQNVVVANTNANKITATKTDENNVVTLNFDNMVIDCGDF